MTRAFLCPELQPHSFAFGETHHLCSRASIRTVLRQRIAALLTVTACCMRGEVRSLTLPQALEIATRQNPDVALARLDVQRAAEGIAVAQDPFRPKVFAGSRLAYTYGYPNSIEGNAPSLFQIKTDMAIYNRPK